MSENQYKLGPDDRRVGREEWLRYGYILKIKPQEIINELAIQCERKIGIKNDPMVFTS